MQKEKAKEKNIAEQISDNILVPNVSLGMFKFENNIKQYLRKAPYSYEEDPDTENGSSFDSYDFYTKGLSVWTDSKGIIKSVRCDTQCSWNNVNIINLSLKKFKEIFCIEPNDEDICYLMYGTMKSQHVYDFDAVGLQVWTWYGKIKTVIACRLPND